LGELDVKHGNVFVLSIAKGLIHELRLETKGFVEHNNAHHF
jgi:hypothetical protein